MPDLVETVSAGAPAPGQLVTVRNRQWIASDVVASTVASSDATASFTTPPQHAVTLVSIEDDARDEELRVVWELEYGAVAHDQHVLPSPERGFDEPERLDAFLDAVRWGAIASADRTALQAPFRSGIQIEDYQLDPVVRALSMPRTNLLVADDVGLGKTVEAGLVMQELMLRHRARTMLVVCPAGLTVQWRDEMRDKFGLDFRIVDTGMLKELRRSRGLYANPWTHYPRLIVSIDWLKRERPMRLLREVLPPVPNYPRAFDLLVVDEVHTCVPSGTGRYAVDSQRTRAIRALAPHCEHRLFLSATPHNGYLESFTALLELLDDQRFARGVKPNPEQLAQVMVRRLKRDLPPRWDGTPRFPQRVLEVLPVGYDDAEREAHGMLAAYAASRRQAASGGAQRTAADFVTTLLKKRLFSSPKAFAETVDAHLATMNAHEHVPLGLGVRPSLAEEAGTRVLRPLIDRLEETAEDDAAFASAATEAFSVVREVAAPLSAEERKLLERLRSWARGAQDRADGKFRAFTAWLDPIVRPGGQWSDQRVIVFTEYRDTQRWLYERLVAAGVPAERIAQLHGGQDEKEREHVKNVFQESPHLPGGEVRILLATDAASEGINLQRYCHRLLHWEIPWNPNRLEQRNGRIDRHGQRASRVEVFHFVPAGWERAEADPDAFAEGSLENELYFLHHAARKVDQIREDLGSAGEVIATQVEQKMLGKRADWQTADAEITRRSGRAVLKIERDLARDLQRLTEALADSRSELNLSPATVERVVRTGLALAHRKDLIPAKAPEGVRAACFRLPELPGAWADARNDGLHHPVTGAERPVTFDADAVADRTDLVLLHLGHRLVQMCLRLLRAEIWAGGAGAKLSRVTARVVPGATLRTPAVIAHGRVVVTGSEGTRLHEEIVTAGGLIEGGKLVRAKEADLTSWLDAATEQLPDTALLGRLTDLWPTLEGPLGRALGARAEQRARSLHSLLERRCNEEVTGVESVLADLERSIRTALSDHAHWEQASLFEVAAEANQLRKDRAALTERLQAIPGLREQETAALRRRYADPTARWFPAAVTFLVPSALARGAR
ncbi:DISARM system SNF2-like helicase DrmD [Streptomyces sp. ME19-03-3]|nr:DISARM system SNF2-like helicase DrmD [Streptomyces sp. ME19-03-3]